MNIVSDDSGQIVSPSQAAGPSRSPRSNSIASVLIGAPANPRSESDKPRTARACSSCNKQKLRCDGGRPCSRCTALGTQTSCEYLPSLRGKTRKRKADRDNERPSGSDILDGKKNKGEYFDLWQKENKLADTVPRNSTLWADDRRPPSPSFNIGQSPRMSVDKLTTLPLPGDVHNPLSVLAEASANPVDPRSPIAGLRGKDAEDKGYYAPLERVLKDEAPHIMSRINVHEAEQLFNLYFKYLHPHLPTLDIQHSSPSAVARRNNFLFNAICCTAARAFDVALWERLREFAAYEMERLPREKILEVVQGHLIYSSWNLIRPKNFEQDQTWLRVGIAMRTSIDINLHRVALLKEARDGLPTWLSRSIIRTWLCGYIIDRTLSAQLGKPSSVRGENSVSFYMDLIRQGMQGGKDDVRVASLAEWTQILARALDTFRSEITLHSYKEFGATLANQTSFSDLVHVFEKQFGQWREKSESAARACGAEEGEINFMIGNIRLYHSYARLVVRSFGLQKAAEDNGVDLPAAFLEYQSASTALIETFETDLASPGFIRGCPDFVFTVLTYAAVSLLRITQPRFAYLEPNRARIFVIVQKAADMLARSAMTPDHLPAFQSAFLSRLIEVKSAEMPNRHQQQPFIPEMIDFEAFGQSLEGDQSKTLWPPAPFSFDLSNFTGNQASSSDYPGALNKMTRDPNNSLSARAASTSSGHLTAPTDLNEWVAANRFPMPGLSLGMGSNFGQDDLMFTQDSFWKTIFEGQPQGQNQGMV